MKGEIRSGMSLTEVVVTIIVRDSSRPPTEIMVVSEANDSPAGGGKTEASQGKSDFWIVKIDQGGSKIWDKRYGGAMKDQCLLAIELGNGDFILGGYSGSGMDGDKSQWNMGHTDGWLLRVDQYGNKKSGTSLTEEMDGMN